MRLCAVVPTYVTEPGSTSTAALASSSSWFERLFCGVLPSYQPAPLPPSKATTGAGSAAHAGQSGAGYDPAEYVPTTLAREPVLVIPDSAWELLVGKARRITVVRTIG